MNKRGESCSLSREDLERLARIGVSGTNRAVKMGNELTDQLINAREKAHKESHDAALGYRTRRHAMSIEASPISLVDVRKERSFTSAALPRARQRAVTRKNKMSKIVLSVALAGTLFGGLSFTQHEKMEEAHQVVEIVDAGNYNPTLEGYELEKNANGTYVFRDMEGHGARQVNGIEARDLGMLIEEITDNFSENENVEESQQTVVDAGDYNPILEGYELEKNANGTYLFRDMEGHGMRQVNGIEARDLGASIETYNEQSQSGPVL